MAQPTPEKLLQMTLERTSGGRNNAGLWLAQQLHANGYSESDAEAVMLDYVAQVRDAGSGSYTAAEARSTLRAEYKRQAKDPWGNGSGQRSGSRKDRAREQLRRAFPTAPAKQEKKEPDPDSVKGFKEQVKNLSSFANSPAEEYLEGRGIPADLARSARCRYASTWGKIGEAVVFPIIGEDGKAVAANGRSLTGKTNRTYGPKSEGVFCTPGALEADPVAIVEAPIDALSLAAAGLPAVAICGCSGLPSWLAKELARPAADTPAGHSRTVYLAFDNDKAGETAAARTGPSLPLVRTSRLRPQLKDWNEDLTKCGIGSVRDWLSEFCGRVHGADVTTAKLPAPSGTNQEIAPDPVETTSGGELAAVECDSCEEDPAGLCPDSEPVAESQGRGVLGDPAADPDPADVEALADRIKAGLAGRPLPIRIKPGEQITGVEVYALAEARSVLNKSPAISRPALERLKLLGVEVDT